MMMAPRLAKRKRGHLMPFVPIIDG